MATTLKQMSDRLDELEMAVFGALNTVEAKAERKKAEKVETEKDANA